MNESDEIPIVTEETKNIRQVSMVGMNHAVHVISSYEGEDIACLAGHALGILESLKAVEHNGIE